MSFSIQLLPVVLAGFVGLVLGTLYFGGLWWTVGRLHDSPHPMRLYATSLVARLAALLVPFFFLLQRFGLIEVFVAVGGLLLARLFWIRRVGATRTFSSEKAVG